MPFKLSNSLSKARAYRLLVEGGWILTGQVASVIGGLMLVRVLTEHLNPAQYGELALGLTVAGPINLVVMGCLTAGIGRYYSIAAEKKELPSYLRATRRLLFRATALVTVLAMLLVTGLWCMGLGRWIPLALIIVTYAISSSYYAVVCSIQNAARQRATVAIHAGIDAWLKIVLAVGAMWWWGNSAIAVVAGYCLSSIAITSAQIYLLRRYVGSIEGKNQQAETDWVKQIWGYSWPFATWGLFGWFQQSSGRWALEAYASTADVGLYSVLSQLGYSPVIMATSLAMTLINPVLFAKAGDAMCEIRNDHVRKLNSKMVFFGVIITAFAVITGAFLHSFLFRVFVSESYAFASHYLPWLILSGGLFAVAQIYASLLMTLNKTRLLTFACIGSSLIGIMASFVCTNEFGLSGAIAASLIHGLSYLILVAMAIRKERRLDLRP